MTDLKHLRDEAHRLRFKAHEKLNYAYREITKALSFIKSSDYQKATQEGELANRFYSEAIQLENEATNIDQHVFELEKQAEELDRQTLELQNTFHIKNEMLEKHRKTILGIY